MPTVRRSAQDLAAEHVAFIPLANAEDENYISDAWDRKGFASHVAQGMGTGTAKIYGSVLPSSNLAVPFAASEWAEIGTITGGTFLKIPEAYAALRLVRTVGTAAFAVHLLSYHPPYAG